MVIMGISEFASELINNYHWTYNHFDHIVASVASVATTSALPSTTNILQLMASLVVVTLLWDITTQMLFGYSFARGRDIFSMKPSSSKKAPSVKVKDTTEEDRALMRASYRISERRNGNIFKTHLQVVMLITVLQFAGAAFIFAITSLITTPYNPAYSIDLLGGTKFVAHVILLFTGVILFLEGYFRFRDSRRGGIDPLKPEFRMSGNSGIKMLMIGLSLFASPVVLVVLIISYGVDNTQLGIIVVAAMFVVAVVVRFLAMVAGYGAYKGATCNNPKTVTVVETSTQSGVSIPLVLNYNENCTRFYITKILIGGSMVIAVGVSYLLY